jgi:hypothetical protein
VPRTLWQWDAREAAGAPPWAAAGTYAEEGKRRFVHLSLPKDRPPWSLALPVTLPSPCRCLVRVEGRVRSGKPGVSFPGHWVALEGTGARDWAISFLLEEREAQPFLVLTPGTALELSSVRVELPEPGEVCFELVWMRIRQDYLVREETSAAWANLPFHDAAAPQTPLAVDLSPPDAVAEVRRLPDDGSHTQRLALRFASGPARKQRRVGYEAWFVRECVAPSPREAWDLPVPLPPVHARGLERFLAPTEISQADDPAVRAQAAGLLEGCSTAADYIGRVGEWAVGHMGKLTQPQDAVTFVTRHGTCLAAGHAVVALLRAVGIPAYPSYVEMPCVGTTEMHCLPTVAHAGAAAAHVWSMSPMYGRDRCLVLQHAVPEQEVIGHTLGMVAYPRPWFAEEQPLCVAGAVRCEVRVEGTIVTDEHAAVAVRTAMGELSRAWLMARPVGPALVRGWLADLARGGGPALADCLRERTAELPRHRWQ